MATSYDTNNGYSTTGSFILVANGELELKQEILGNLPDECYEPGRMDWDAFWNRVVAARDGGQADPVKLAQLYKVS